MTATYPDFGEIPWDVELKEYIDASGTYGLAGVELASSEVAYSFPTAFPVSPATANAVIGSQIIIPPTDGPVEVTYGATGAVAVSGNGLLQLQLWKQADFTVPTFTSVGVVSAQITSFSGGGIEFNGTYRLPADDDVRLFFLAAQMFRDAGSGLTASLVNTPSKPSWLRAVGL